MIPTALRALELFPQWIVWREYPGKDKPRKVPVDWRTCQPGDAHDSGAWQSYKQAEFLTRCDPTLHIGFVLTPGCGIFCIDIDNCLTSSGWSAKALAICQHFPGAAVEVSHSGRGLHIWGMSSAIPTHACKRSGTPFELYTDSRFIAIGTGAVGQVATDCTAALAAIITHYLPASVTSTLPTEWTSTPCEGWDGLTDDAELIAKALKSRSSHSIFGGKATFKNLWQADAEALSAAYPSTSEREYDASSADAALAQHLAFWTGRNCERIRSLMLMSALKRDKWEREDYLPRTIIRACAMQRDVYHAPRQPAPPAPHVVEALTNPDAPATYYYGKYSRDFLMHNKRGWMSISEGSFRNVLAGQGFSKKAAGDELLSVADQYINRIRMENDVDYAESLAGHRQGLYTVNSHQVLVTDDPVIIGPKPGSYALVDSFFRGLLRDDEPQIDYFYSWLKVAYESLRSGEFRPGQAVALVGPRDCGKSLAQSLITLILGGREANPYKYMVGDTSFNGGLFKAEHLRIDDAVASTDIRARREFGSQIKQVTANPMQSCHGKFKEELSLDPFWRLTISLNDGAENITILPPMDPDIEDKIMIFQALRAPMIPTDFNNRKAFWNAITSQIPAFVNMLMAWEIPADIRSGRFGVAHYHNPHIMAELKQQQPEERLKEFIDQYLFTDDNVAWEGTADDLEKTLGERSYGGAQKLLGKWSQACGTYLSRLATKYPGYVARLPRADNMRMWIIRSTK